jgi:hypothetical protein
MTATPIRRLLKAKPFVRFTLTIGFDNEIRIDDPKRCRLDEEELVLYVSYPEVRPPERFAKRLRALEEASVEVIDLRHVTQVSVKAAAMPD